jgi:hypothetical protein
LKRNCVWGYAKSTAGLTYSRSCLRRRSFVRYSVAAQLFLPRHRPLDPLPASLAEPSRAALADALPYIGVRIETGRQPDYGSWRPIRAEYQHTLPRHATPRHATACCVCGRGVVLFPWKRQDQKLTKVQTVSYMQGPKARAKLPCPRYELGAWCTGPPCFSLIALSYSLPFFFLVYLFLSSIQCCYSLVGDRTDTLRYAKDDPGIGVRYLVAHVHIPFLHRIKTAAATTQ